MTPKGQGRDHTVSLKLNISKKCETDGWLKLTSNRKLDIRSPMVTRAMMSLVANGDSLSCGVC